VDPYELLDGKASDPSYSIAHGYCLKYLGPASGFSLELVGGR
jgi:hypothetical protein